MTIWIIVRFILRWLGYLGASYAVFAAGTQYHARGAVTSLDWGGLLAVLVPAIIAIVSGRAKEGWGMIWEYVKSLFNVPTNPRKSAMRKAAKARDAMVDATLDLEGYVPHDLVHQAHDVGNKLVEHVCCGEFKGK